MTERCVDASVIIKLVFKGERHLFISEVDTAIRKRAYEGSLSPTDAQRAYAVLDQAPVRIVTLESLRRRAREIAEEFNQRTVYDATYAALAELRGCEFGQQIGFFIML